MNRLNRRTVRVRLTPDLPVPAGHPLLTGYRPAPLRRSPATPAAPVTPVVRALPAGLLGAADAATALGIPEPVLRTLAAAASDLLPPVHWVEDQPCFTGGTETAWYLPGRHTRGPTRDGFHALGWAALEAE
jgi:hypothetical protein